MLRARYALYSLVIALLLAGCGQSGPLYMPGNPSQMTVPATQQPAESTEDEGEETDDNDKE